MYLYIYIPIYFIYIYIGIYIILSKGLALDSDAVTTMGRLKPTDSLLEGKHSSNRPLGCAHNHVLHVFHYVCHAV